MGMCPYLNEISVVREMGHHRSHIGAWICGVRVGKREVPQRMTGIVLSRGTRRGNGWRAEQAGTADSWVHQHSPPPPPSHTYTCAPARGASVLPTSSWPSQGGTGRENLTPLAHRSQRSAFVPGSLFTHTLCLCFHRNFSLLICLETPER